MKIAKTIKGLPKELRPRERSLVVGLENLPDHELLAIVLRTGYKDHSAIDLGLSLLRTYGTILEISRTAVEELCKTKGIGTSKATALLASFELARRTSGIPGKKTIIRSSKEASLVLEKNLRGLKKEHFQILMLNTKNHLLGIETISIGSLNSSIVHPRELFATDRKSVV